MKSSHVVLSVGPRLGAAGLFAAALLCGSIAPACAAPTFSLAPSATTVLQNQAFTVNVLVNDVTDLFGYQFDVSYDPSLFSVTSVSEVSFLSAGGSTFFSPGTIDDTAGSVSFVFDTILGGIDGVSGSGLLGTINFSALGTAAGSGSIGLNEVSALNSALDTIDLATVAPAVVAVVPEPATWALLSLGLVGMLGLRRRPSVGARQA